MKIITVAIQKGGTAKTTTAVVLAQAAAFRGKRALLIDLDPQGNASFAAGADMRSGSSYDLLTGTPAADLVQPVRAGLDVIPASLNLYTITSGKGSARRLQKALAPIKKNYDFIVIDTPTAGELQYNALQASTGLVIPLQVDMYNLQSLYQTTDTARQIQGSNPGLSITGFIFTVFDGRATFDKKTKEIIIDRAAAVGVPYLGTIRKGVAIKEAAGFQQSLFDYAPKSKPAADYLALYDTIAAQEV